MPFIILILGLIVSSYSNEGVLTHITYLDSNDGTQRTIGPVQSDLDIVVTGNIARAKLTQTFVNPTLQNLNELAYVFPLPWQGSVHGMAYEYGGQSYIAEILEKEEAQERFDSLQQEGQQAALLTEQSPSIFVQKFSNLSAGDTVKIEIVLSLQVPRENGKYQLAFPTMVADRYGSSSTNNGYNPPDSLSQGELTVDVLVLSSLGIKNMQSPSHSMIFETDVSNDTTLSSRGILEAGVEILQDYSMGAWFSNQASFLNSDFVLEWEPIVNGIAVDINTWKPSAQDTGFFALQLMPDLQPSSAPEPLELILLMDISGSQSGWPLEYQKDIAINLLNQLEFGDRVQLIVFNSTYYSLWEAPVEANSANISEAMTRIESLRANGGTNLLGAIEASLEEPWGDIQRIYCFLTDGFITNELEIFEALENSTNPLSIFTFGTGNNANRYFLDYAANIGNGFSTIVLNGQDPDSLAEVAWGKIESPQLSHIEYAFAKAQVYDVNEPSVKTLFQGGSWESTGKFLGSGLDTLIIQGKKGSEDWEMKKSIYLYPINLAAQSIPKLWARNKIQDLYHSQDIATEENKNAIIQLSIDYSVLSPYTAFLAYSNNTPELDLQSGQLNTLSLESNTAKESFGLDLTITTDPQLHQITIDFSQSIGVQFVSVFNVQGDVLKIFSLEEVQEGQVTWNSNANLMQTYVIQVISEAGVTHRTLTF